MFAHRFVHACRKLCNEAKSPKEGQVSPKEGQVESAANLRKSIMTRTGKFVKIRLNSCCGCGMSPAIELPCKHIFCVECSKLFADKCLACNERHERSHLMIKPFVVDPFCGRRLLSIDGGGTRILSVVFTLKSVENEVKSIYQSIFPSCEALPMRVFFDFFCGTSGGALLAAALMTGDSLDNIENLCESFGKSLFAPYFIYSSSRSDEAKKLFGQYLDSKKRKMLIDGSNGVLLAVATDVQGRHEAIILSSNIGLSGEDAHTPKVIQSTDVVDVLCASSAAPPYFQQHFKRA